MTTRFIKILCAFLKLDLKRTYLRKYFIFIELLSILLTLVIYYYSSQAFTPRLGETLNFFGADLFTFLFWGDLLLRIPQNLFYSPISNIKQAINENTFDSMVLFSGSLKKVLLSISMMEILREFLSITFMLALGISFFGLNINISTIVHLLINILLFLPLFLALGLFISGIVFHFERGENSLPLVSNMMAILAGMYFPTQVFPDFVRIIGEALTPYALFLKTARESIQIGNLNWTLLAVILPLGILLAWLSLNFIIFILNRKKCQGRILIIG